jgi:hypothetical protein
MTARVRSNYCVCPVARRQLPPPISYGLPSNERRAMPEPDVVVSHGCVVEPEQWWCLTCRRPLDPEREPTSEEVQASRRRVEAWERAIETCVSNVLCKA